MIRIEFHSEAYQTSDWFPAWLTKNGRSMKVLVGLPYYTWKKTVEEFVERRGFSVTWS